MIKARNKKLSLVLVLAMLMTMFAGLGTAGAATTISASDAPIVTTDNSTQRVGSVIVQFDNLPAVNTPVAGANKSHQFIVKLPDDFDIDSVTATVVKPDSGYIPQVYAIATGGPYDLTNSGVAAAFNGVLASTPAGVTNQLLLEVYSTQLVSELKLAIGLTTKVPTSAPEEIRAMVIGESGSVFGDGVAVVAKTSASSVMALAGDPITVTGAGISDGKSAVIYLRENKGGALLKGNKSFTLKLPQGFEWDENALSFAPLTDTSEFATPVKTDARTLTFNRNTDALPGSIWKFTASQLIVDESVAKFGDVSVTIGGASSIAPSSVVIGKYADYGVDIKVADPDTKVLAGRKAEYVSDIKVEELIGDSLINGRTIYLELEDGFKWVNSGEWNIPTSGGVKYATGSPRIDNNKPELLKVVIADNGTPKGTLEINRAQIDIAANIKNDTDVKVKIWGNAGIDKEIVIGKVVAPFSAKADVKDVKIGLQNQVAGDIVITETQAEAIASSVYTELGPVDGYLTVALPFNVTWAKIPTVKVVEGDLELGTITRTLDNRVLSMRVKTSSSVASKIEISDILYTADRTVPEGDMIATFGGNAVDHSQFVNRMYVTKEAVANCVTPAPNETIGTGEFRIGSNIYYVAGVAKVMDVAPYIKGDRTYVPMRYLGEILGAEVVWDATARTVTLTKGDTTVVFTVGSTTYTVNGESKTADVAPEIVNDRTMLPARFVAEAFGAVVGWDPATQTVVISK